MVEKKNKRVPKSLAAAVKDSMRNSAQSADEKTVPRQSSEALKPYWWKRGQSGNPAGRPPNKPTLTEYMKARIHEVCETDRKKRTYGEILADRTIVLALEGNATALREVFDRIDGRLAQPIEGKIDVTTQHTERRLLQILEANPESKQLFHRLVTASLGQGIEPEGEGGLPALIQPLDKSE